MSKVTENIKEFEQSLMEGDFTPTQHNDLVENAAFLACLPQEARDAWYAYYKLVQVLPETDWIFNLEKHMYQENNDGYRASMVQNMTRLLQLMRMELIRVNEELLGHKITTSAQKVPRENHG